MSQAGILVMNLIASSTHAPISFARRIERSFHPCADSENCFSLIVWSSSSEKFHTLFMARSASHADPFSPNTFCESSELLSANQMSGLVHPHFSLVSL